MKLGVTRGAFGRWEWRGDPADCENVRALLFDGEPPAGIRRRPEDIAGWPEISRVLTPLELDAEERALYDALQAAAAQAQEHVAREDFEGAMSALAILRPAVDAFFDKVTVNADEPSLRANRLRLLNLLRQATREVADFSRIEG